MSVSGMTGSSVPGPIPPQRLLTWCNNYSAVDESFRELEDVSADMGREEARYMGDIC
jgi:hypothetical protein